MEQRLSLSLNKRKGAQGSVQLLYSWIFKLATAPEFFTVLLFILSSIESIAKPELSHSDCSIYLGSHKPVESASDLVAKYGVPNEPNPFDAKDLISFAPKGIYAVIGGERALFDFLLAEEKNVEILLALDQDPGIVHFHALNSILIKLADDGDTEAYRRLRFTPDISEWNHFAEQARKSHRISAAEFQVITQAENEVWWKQLMDKPEWQQLKRKPLSPKDPFFGVNYLYDSKLFLRIQKLALTDRYKTHRLDLRRSEQVLNLTHLLRSLNKPLAFLDLSNAWEDNFPNIYLGPHRTGLFLEKMNDLAVDNSVIMITFGHKPFQPMWYRAYTYGAFRFCTERIDNRSGTAHLWAQCAAKFQEEYKKVQSDYAKGLTSPSAAFRAPF